MHSDANSVHSRDPDVPRFGTFLGVYTPSVLTILGVMMYLRFGWVLGNLGLPLTLLTVFLASSITFITGLSASAIATNMKVGVGGEYYMISRSLGLELGGAIGIPLFLCRTLSLTLYAFGLAESLSFLWPEAWGVPPLQWAAAFIIVITTAISGKSAKLSLKLQIPIMIAVGLSLAALAGGVFTGGFSTPEMAPHYQRSAPEGFWYVFAVFFPAVTGFTAGVGMSGDLRDPKRSIPKGTILAVATGTAVYLTIPVLLSMTARVTPQEMATLDLNSPPIWTNIALLGYWLVYPGMWGAILSSAFGSALGGPRVLQALANDGLVPKALSRLSKTGQPTVATWVTGGIALVAVLLGDLNAVGRWVTIFFLTLYVTINLSSAIESLVGDPSYRPTIKTPWYLSLLGCLGAVFVMFLISPVACIAAMTLELALYLFLRRRGFKTGWGDVWAGFWTALARFSLMKLKTRPKQARNWRPNILVFAPEPEQNLGLVRMASWFNQGRGLVTVCQIVEGQVKEEAPFLGERRAAMDGVFSKEGEVVFSQVSIVPEFEPGILNIAQSNGIAGLHSNTVMFAWPSRIEGLARILRVMRRIASLEISTIIARLPRDKGPEYHERIDVWWGGLQNNGDLMLLLSHLLCMNQAWRTATVKVRTIVDSEESRQEFETRLSDLIAEGRINAEAALIVKPPSKTIVEIMHETSANADLVFLGLMLPERGREDDYATRLNEFVSGFRNVILVRNASPFAGKLIMP